MTRPAPVAAAVLGAVLVGACATVNLPGGDDALVERVRQEIVTNPRLSGARVTVTERDGIIVIDGAVDSLEDLNVIRDVASGVEDEATVENNVIVKSDEGVGPDEAEERPAS